MIMAKLISPMVSYPSCFKFIEGLLNPKVKMLTEDKTRLGPGCYEVTDLHLKQSPKVNIC